MDRGFIEGIFRDLPMLETERLILRKLSRNDAWDVFQYASDPEVSRYVSWDTHQIIEDSLRFIDSQIQCYETGRVSNWGIVLKKEGKLTGTGGFIKLMLEDSCGEIGYVLSRPYWNRGLMSEAVKAIIGFGFERLSLKRIEARCFVENVASARVMEKAGMTFEGILRESLYAKGRHWDVKLYSILLREYLSLKSKDE